MLFNWDDDTHKLALLLCSHHPQRIKWHFRMLDKPVLKSEVAEEGGEKGREGGKGKENERILGDKFPGGKSIICNH